MSDTVEFLGLRFAPIALAAALDRIVARADEGAPFAYVVTPNVDHVVSLPREYERRAPLYETAWLTLNDSRILEVLARRSGLALPACPGADLTTALFDRIDPAEPVIIVGGSEATIGGLQRRYKLTDVRWHAPPMGLADTPAAIARAAQFIAAHRARFVFLALGAPQQEMVAMAALERGDCSGVGLCIGASLDFLAGVQRRAPPWMRTQRLEWLHRLMREPGRLGRRYLRDGPAIFAIWRGWRKRQRAASRASMTSRN